MSKRKVPQTSPTTPPILLNPLSKPSPQTFHVCPFIVCGKNSVIAALLRHALTSESILSMRTLYFGRMCGPSHFK